MTLQGLRCSNFPINIQTFDTNLILFLMFGPQFHSQEIADSEAHAIRVDPIDTLTFQQGHFEDSTNFNGNVRGVVSTIKAHSKLPESMIQMSIFAHTIQLPWHVIVIHYRPQLMTRFQLGGFMLNLRALILTKYLQLVFRTFHFTYNRQLVALTFGTTLIDVPSRSAQALSTYCQFCTFQYFHFSKMFFSKHPENSSDGLIIHAATVPGCSHWRENWSARCVLGHKIEPKFL